MSTSVRIEAADLDEPQAEQLISELNAELTERYPEEGANHFRLDPADVAPDRGVFLLAVDDATGEAIGCGAVRMLEPGTAEIKRMYVRPAARGRGVGTALLGALEAEAGALFADRMVLETGDRQDEALALYLRAGYSAIPCFGEYANSPLSLCMERMLSPWAPCSR